MAPQSPLELSRLQCGAEVALAFPLPSGEVAALGSVEADPAAKSGARKCQPNITWLDPFHEGEQVRALLGLS